MEKILQVAVDLPAVPTQVLNRQIFAALNDALSDIENSGPFDENAWPDLFMEVIQPLIRNIRDVRRYAASVRGTAKSLDGQIALADVLALEAVRIFLPDVFARLHGAVEGLTTTTELTFAGRGDSPHLKAQIDGLIEAAKQQELVVRAMIDRLFPGGQRHIGGMGYGGDWKHRWLRERRVAHEEILRLYLERVAGERLLAFTDAEQAWALMANRDAFDGYLRSLEAERLEDVISALEAYEDQFDAEHVVPATIVLLNLLPDLPERQRGFFDLDRRLVVGRVTYRLLRSLDGPAAVEAAVRRVLPELKSLSAKLEVISDVGYREGVGHKLVPEPVAAELEKAWRNEVRSVEVEDLAQEDDLVRTLLLTKREADSSEGTFSIDDSPRLTLAILRSARSEVRSQAMGSRAVRRSPRLAWDALIEIYGNEALLRERVEALKVSGLQDDDGLLELAGKYLDGWRPNDFGED